MEFGFQNLSEGRGKGDIVEERRENRVGYEGEGEGTGEDGKRE